MPIYDYVCTRCGLRIEVMHSVAGHGPSTCTSCGGPMKKAVSAPAVHFVGKGWARKDRAITTQLARERSARAAAAGSSEGSDTVTAGTGSAPAPEPAPEPAAKDPD
jgi:putative FmdB family regulatory protein